MYLFLTIFLRSALFWDVRRNMPEDRRSDQHHCGSLKSKPFSCSEILSLVWCIDTTFCRWRSISFALNVLYFSVMPSIGDMVWCFNISVQNFNLNKVRFLLGCALCMSLFCSQKWRQYCIVWHNDKILPSIILNKMLLLFLEIFSVSCTIKQLQCVHDTFLFTSNFTGLRNQTGTRGGIVMYRE